MPKPVDVSPVFTSVLQKPSTVTSKSKYTPRTLNILKHFGEDFIALMEAKEGEVRGKRIERGTEERKRREEERT